MAFSYNSIYKCDLDIRRDLYGNIVMVCSARTNLLPEICKLICSIVWWYHYVPWYCGSYAEGTYLVISIKHEGQDCCTP